MCASVLNKIAGYQDYKHFIKLASTIGRCMRKVIPLPALLYVCWISRNDLHFPIYTFQNLCEKDGFMKIFSKLFCLLVVLNLAPYLIPSSFAANGIKKPLQGHIKKGGKFKLSRSKNTKTANSYSLSQPYNPNNPPPIDNKIHPVSSNAR
jgi:hypothetical protein